MIDHRKRSQAPLASLTMPAETISSECRTLQIWRDFFSFSFCLGKWLDALQEALEIVLSACFYSVYMDSLA